MGIPESGKVKALLQSERIIWEDLPYHLEACWVFTKLLKYQVDWGGGGQRDIFSLLRFPKFP